MGVARVQDRGRSTLIPSSEAGSTAARFHSGIASKVSDTLLRA